MVGMLVYFFKPIKGLLYLFVFQEKSWIRIRVLEKEKQALVYFVLHLKNFRLKYISP